MPIHPDTSVGAVALTVADLPRAREFYERVVGLQPHEPEDGTVALGAPDGAPLVKLVADPSARPPDPRSTGLFHLAILVPTRRDLGLTLRRLAESRWPLTGASDHLVSEALYLSDPEGNGIEIYRDRTREEWPHRDGKLQMATLPLDLQGVIAELEGSDERASAVPEQTRMGHAHLKVANLQAAGEFYAGALGFDVAVREYPGALFVSAGGYHHHIGMNTWQSAGGAAPPPGSAGMRSFEVVLPAANELEEILERLETAGISAERADGSAHVRDPSGNGVLFTVRR